MESTNLTDLLDKLNRLSMSSQELAMMLESEGPVATSRFLGRQEILDLVFQECKEKYGAVPPPIEAENPDTSQRVLSADEYLDMLDNVRKAEDA